MAGLIRKRALVYSGWVAERLSMGARNALSRTIRMAMERVKPDRKAQLLAKKIEKNVK